MNQIPPYSLWLGHAGDGRDSQRILDAGIEAVVHLAAEEPPLHLPRELTYLRFPLVDGPDNPAGLLELAVTSVARLLKLGKPTLVCCGAGMSRTPAVAAAAPAILGGETPESCLVRVTEHHASDVLPGLWAEVVASVIARSGDLPL